MTCGAISIIKYFRNAKEQYISLLSIWINVLGDDYVTLKRHEAT